MEISKTDFFDIMTMYNNEISDGHSLPQKTKYTHPPQRRFQFFLRFSSLTAKNTLREVAAKKSLTTR